MGHRLQEPPARRRDWRDRRDRRGRGSGARAAGEDLAVVRLVPTIAHPALETAELHQFEKGR